MPIVTLDTVKSRTGMVRPFAKATTPTLVAGKPQSLWGLGGNPIAGTFDTTLNGITLSGSGTQVTGQIYYTDPASATQNSYLSRFQAQATVAGTLILADRLWHNGGFTITSTSPQAITSPTWPARDAGGSTNGDGVLLGLEISAAAGAAAPTITVAYTNSVGDSARSGANWFPTANSPAAGSFFPIGLQAGDTGVRSVQSLTLSVSWVSGTMNLVAYRPLAALEITAPSVTNAIDAITGGFPKLFVGTVPFFIFVPSTTTASFISGSLSFAQG